MDTDIYKNNLERIINRGGYGKRTVDVAVLKTALELIKENERLIQKLQTIEAVASNGIHDMRAA